MDLEKQVDREENQDELHFILLLLILLIRQSSSEGNPSDLRRQLVFAKELGVPVSKVNLINGDTLQNVIVKEVLTDLVIFQNPFNNTRSHVSLSSVVSWGAF
ncbi:spore maturation protein CgeC [Bacillus subtilis]|uniref:spore maturation protein CgeC n=1 Tax=Bacillus subtilis TaxID=1423 RepID=UPI002DB82DE4|nr:spore maturation protein CgeC [Bacillus subtilis]MEC1539874.1 spore maturation protein CgeC [Bacillus subtilis]